MTNTLILEVSRLPLHQVQAAHAALLGTLMPTTKGDIVRDLVNGIANVQFGLDDIRSAKPVSPTAIRTAQAAGLASAPDPRIDAAVASAGRAESLGLDATNAVHNLRRDHKGFADQVADALTSIDGTVAQHSKVLAKLDKRLDTLGEIVGEVKLDEVAVNAAVAKVVADAFAPFKQAVQDAGQMTVAGALASAWVVDKKPAKDVFGVDVTDNQGRALEVEIWNHPDTPAIDDNFIWTEGILRHLIQSQDTGENVWFGGEKGTGKTETARQFAARTGRAFVRINFEKYTSKEDYLGATGLENGATVFQPQAFLTAFTSPSTVILLDEVTNADAGNLAPLNGFLEPNSAVTYGGAVRRRANGVLVIAADNTLTNGDETGRYAGTRTMNSALADRFARVVQFEFLPVKQEVAALVKHTGCSKDLAEHVMKAITVARAKVKTADIVDAPSIRSAIAFIRALRYNTVETAWQTAVVNRQPSESAAALASIFAACIDTQFINDNI
jgi:cobaltochelatase CobS